MAILVNVVAFFTAVVLGTRIKLEILATHLLKAAKRLFGIPDFRLYALERCLTDRLRDRELLDEA